MSAIPEGGGAIGGETRLIRQVATGYTPFQENDILFAKITPCMENCKGAHALGTRNGYGFGSTEFHVLRPKEGADGRYIFHWTLAPQLRQKAESFMTGSAGQRRVQARFFDCFEIAVPPLPEQRLIAEILDTVDEAIRKTEQIIVKLEQVKQGLLHDLLTRGIDDNGQLRDPDRHPEQFKDSELGRIPKEWEVWRTGDVVDRIEQGWSPDCGSQPARKGQWGVLRTTAVVWSGYDEEENKALPSHLTPRSDLEVRPNDVLMTRAGPNSRVGVVALATATRDRLMFSDKLYRLQPNEDAITPQFLVWALSSSSLQQQLSKLKTGLAESQTNISQSIVRALHLPVPTVPEQVRICEALSAHGERITQESTCLAKFRLFKQGLADDLLTGRVRVTEILQEAAG